MQIFVVRSCFPTFKLLWSLRVMSLQISEKMHPVLPQHTCVMLRRQWIIGKKGKEQLRSGWTGHWATWCSWRCPSHDQKTFKGPFQPRPLCDSLNREMVHRGLCCTVWWQLKPWNCHCEKCIWKSLLVTEIFYHVTFYKQKREEDLFSASDPSPLSWHLSQWSDSGVTVHQGSLWSHPEAAPVKDPAHYLEVPNALNMCELESDLHYLCNP